MYTLGSLVRMGFGVNVARMIVAGMRKGRYLDWANQHPELGYWALILTMLPTA